MKIFCIQDIEQGYSPETSNWYSLPESTVLRSGNPFYIPDFDTNFEVSFALMIRIGRLGKSIAPRFVNRYIGDWTVGGVVKGKNLCEQLLAAGRFPARALCFDRSCWLGNYAGTESPVDDRIELTLEGVPYEISSQVAHAWGCLPAIIADLSRNNIMKMGDIIAVALPGVEAQLKGEDRIRVSNSNNELIDIRVK